jgi:hypothetical protein
MNQYRYRVFKLLFLFASLYAAIGVQGQTADSIMRGYLKAIGGHRNLTKIQSMRMTGVYSEGKDTFNTSILWKRPNHRLVIVGDWGEAYLEGFDGAPWEYSQPTKKLKLTVGTPSEAVARHGAEFDEAIVDPASKGYTVKYVGRETVLGQETLHLEVTFGDGWIKDYYINSRTYLIAATRKSMPVHAHGDPVVSLTAYENYRRVAGVLFAHSFVERRVDTGEVMNKLEWLKIEPNVEVDETKFHPPTETALH